MPASDNFRPDEYWETRLAANFDERGVGDIGMSRSYNEFLYRVRRRVFRRALRKAGITPGSIDVLDIGSGTGFYVREWQAWGASKLTGVDITDTSVKQLRDAFPGFTFIRGDIGDPDLVLPDGAFDAVSAFDVMFHVVDDARYRSAVARIARVLRPGGIFLYSDNLVRREARDTHYVSRTEPVILDTLYAAGFDVTARIPMFVLMNDPVRTRSRWLRRWYGIVWRLARRGRAIGSLAGAAIYPVELLVTQMVKRGPSTEVLICRRR